MAQEDVAQPPQREGRPIRLRQVRPTYPENPIVIPLEREKAAKNALIKVHELWEQEKHLDSLLEWFDLPKDIREDAINGVILQEAQADPSRPLRNAQDDTEGKPENLVLKHYAVLTTDAVGKIVRPVESEPITDKDVTKDLNRNPAISDDFITKLRSLGLGRFLLRHDSDDFETPNDDIRKNFSIEEVRQLLVKLVPHLNEKARLHILSTWGPIDIIKHADLLTDPRLADDLERPLLKGTGSWINYLGGYIARDMLPSVKFFEEAFRRLDPKDSGPNVVFSIPTYEGDVKVPESAFYFTMLRTIIYLKGIRERHPSFLEGEEEKITSYLLSDAFMDHVTPYMQTESAYRDDLVHGIKGKASYITEIEATGEEAKALKRKRLGEVIKTAVDYAEQKGDERTAQKLKEREISGIRFADLINSQA